MIINKQYYKKITKVSVTLMVALTLSSCGTSNNEFRSYAGNTPSNNHKYHNPHRAAQINVQLALQFLNKGDPVRAKKKLLLARQIAANDPMVWYGFGYFFENTGDLAKAEQSYRKALAFNSQVGESHNNFGTFLCRHSRVQEALQHFDLAVKDPEYLDLSGALENAGVCALKLPNNEYKAITYFKKALEYNSSADVALINLAELYYKQHDYKQAKQYLIQLSYMVRPTAYALRLRAQVEEALGNTEEQVKAIATLQKQFLESEHSQV